MNYSDKEDISYAQGAIERPLPSLEIKRRKTPEWFVEPRDTSDYFAGEPTPMNPYLDADVKKHQADVAAALYALTSERAAPEGTPAGVIEMVEHNFMHSQFRLDATNYKSYGEMLDKNETLRGLELTLMNEAARGKAIPAELLHLLIYTQLDSTELGKVTHPYGYRIEHVPELRQRVAAAIIENHGRLHPAITPYRDIKLHPHYTLDDENYHKDFSLNQQLHGMVATYKHDLGWIELDGGRQINIVERQTAAIRIDEASGFDQEIARKMHAFEPCNDTTWRERLARESGCLDHIESAIQHDVSEDYFIPLSTVIYAYETVRQAPGVNTAQLRKLARGGINARDMLVINRHAE